MNFDLYKNTLSHPSRTDFTTTYWYKGGKLIASMTAKQAMPVFVDSGDLAKCVTERHVDEVAYRAARDAYTKEDQRLHTLFHDDLLADLGLTGHPKADCLFGKAWADGHANGYAEVYNVALDLVDLVR